MGFWRSRVGIPPSRPFRHLAGVAQMAERDLAKVEATSSSLVTCSILARVAQLREQPLRKRQAAGWIPAAGSISVASRTQVWKRTCAVPRPFPCGNHTPQGQRRIGASAQSSVRAPATDFAPIAQWRSTSLVWKRLRVQVALGAPPSRPSQAPAGPCNSGTPRSTRGTGSTFAGVA